MKGNKGKWKQEGKMEQEKTLKYVLHRKNVGQLGHKYVNIWGMYCVNNAY